MKKVHYATVTVALEELKAQGFTLDFNLEENLQGFKNGKYNVKDFLIVDVYRYEGNTDPGDESTVYALQSNSGVKGVLVSAYGMAAEAETNELLKNIPKNNS